MKWKPGLLIVCTNLQHVIQQKSNIEKQLCCAKTIGYRRWFITFWDAKRKSQYTSCVGKWKTCQRRLHCKCLQAFTGCPQVFTAISMEKGCDNHREILYSWKGNIVYVVGNPGVIFTDCGEILYVVIIVFSPQSVNITGFPHNRENLQRPHNAL